MNPIKKIIKRIYSDPRAHSKNKKRGHICNTKFSDGTGRSHRCTSPPSHLGRHFCDAKGHKTWERDSLESMKRQEATHHRTFIQESE